MSKKTIPQVWERSKGRIAKVLGFSAAVSAALFLWSLTPMIGSGVAGVVMFIPMVVAAVSLIPMLLIGPIQWWRYSGKVLWKPEEFARYRCDVRPGRPSSDNAHGILWGPAGFAMFMTLVSVACVEHWTPFATVMSTIALPSVVNGIAWLSYRGYAEARDTFCDWREALSSNSQATEEASHE